MNRKWMMVVGMVLLLALAVTAVALAGSLHQAAASQKLVDIVRTSTEQYRNVNAAEAAGYGLFHGCVSGAQEGAMGIHMVNGDLVGDGALDATRPEALLYEFKDGRMSLLGVEYVVIAEAWDANHDGPPVLEGQLFNFVGSPNRYGIPAFYELHVWAWRSNTAGLFADFNPKVSCRDYTAAGHH